MMGSRVANKPWSFCSREPLPALPPWDVWKPDIKVDRLCTCEFLVKDV